MSRICCVFSMLLILITTIGKSNAQDHRQPFAPIIPPGQNEIIVAHPDQIPERLVAALKTTECRYEQWLSNLPIRIFRNGSRQIALVPCGSIIVSSKAFVFQARLSAQLMVFPVIEPRQGIMMTHEPGFLEWHPDRRLLSATQNSDMCPHRKFRYIYRLESPGGLEGIPTTAVLLNAEISTDTCNTLPVEWRTYWEAPKLPLPEKAN